MHGLHGAQRKAFLADPYPSAAERKTHLAALARTVLGHRDDIRAAMNEDFGAHPELFATPSSTWTTTPWWSTTYVRWPAPPTPTSTPSWPT
jgi:hypothetical protein